MNENQLTLVKEYEFDEPLFQKIDSIIDKSIRDCHDNYFHTFDHICENNLNFTNITNNETVNLTFSDENMGLFELNKKLTVARQNGFIFNQINKLTIKISSNFQSIKLCYYLKFRIPMYHRLFFRKISQTKEYVENFCDELNNPFHFACRNWYLDNQTL